MKVFISYKFTGEAEEDLHKLLTPLRDALQQAAGAVYCNFFDHDLAVRSKNFKPQDYVFDAFKMIDTSELMFVILNSDEKSEGMILEVGYALAKTIPIIVARRVGIENTYLAGMADRIIDWNDVDELAAKIQAIDFTAVAAGAQK